MVHAKHTAYYSQDIVYLIIRQLIIYEVSLRLSKLLYNNNNNMCYMIKQLIFRFEYLNEIKMISKKVNQMVIEKSENMRMLVRLEVIRVLALI